MTYRVEKPSAIRTAWERLARIRNSKLQNRSDIQLQIIFDECSIIYEHLMGLPPTSIEDLELKLKAVVMEYGDRPTDLVPADTVERLCRDLASLINQERPG